MKRITRILLLSPALLRLCPLCTIFMYINTDWMETVRMGTAAPHAAVVPAAQAVLPAQAAADAEDAAESDL